MEVQKDLSCLGRNWMRTSVSAKQVGVKERGWTNGTNLEKSLTTKEEDYVQFWGLITEEKCAARD